MADTSSDFTTQLLDGGRNDEPTSNSQGWQTVVYPKRQKKAASKPSPANPQPNGVIPGDNASKVFQQLEERAEARHRVLQSQKRSQQIADDVQPSKPRHRSDEEDESEEDEISGGREDGKADDPKKLKPKKTKKPKITVQDAALRIDAADLTSFLADVQVQYESQQGIQLVRLADYFGRAFSCVSASQFPWTKVFRDSNLTRIADIPICYVPESVYRTSVDWIGHCLPESLSSFILWCLDNIFEDVVSSKAAKKTAQQTPSKSKVAIFVVLAMVLRRRPDTLISILPRLREEAKYQGQEKTTVIVWSIAQVSHGDVPVGLLAWGHNLIPKLYTEPGSADLILQLVERILSSPKSRSILLNSAVRKGERLLPPSALETLVRLTFPAPSAPIKAHTRVHVAERLGPLYPLLKEVALAGSPASKSLKQLAQQLLTHAVKLAGGSSPELSREGAEIFIWCLIQNTDCYADWDKMYLENLEASVVVLKTVGEQWKQFSSKNPSIDPLRQALKGFQRKNKSSGLGGGGEEADHYCKVLEKRVSRGGGVCLKALAVVVVAAVAAAGGAVLSAEEVSYLPYWKRLSVLFGSVSFTV